MRKNQLAVFCICARLALTFNKSGGGSANVQKISKLFFAFALALH